MKFFILPKALALISILLYNNNFEKNLFNTCVLFSLHTNMIGGIYLSYISIYGREKKTEGKLVYLVCINGYIMINKSKANLEHI